MFHGLMHVHASPVGLLVFIVFIALLVRAVGRE